MERPSFTLADATRRERAYVRRRRRQAIGTVVAVVLIAGNIALFIWREPVIAWVRQTFGTYEVQIEQGDR